jgi:hypothetical protein
VIPVGQFHVSRARSQARSAGCSLNDHPERDLRKVRTPLVPDGWDYGRLYQRVEANAAQWQPQLDGLVPDLPPFDETLTTVQRGLGILRAVRPVRS